jgi:hypothetical protein
MTAADLRDLAMAPDDNPQAIAGMIRSALPMVVSGTCLVMIGTSLNMWSTQQLIQQHIQTILKSDAAQTSKIERMAEEVNTVRVDHGITKARVDIMERRDR